jgi:hypothetical protein
VKTTKIQIADLVLDTATHEVTRDGKIIELASKEYAVLEYLMRHAERVVTRTMMLEGPIPNYGVLSLLATLSLAGMAVAASIGVGRLSLSRVSDALREQ